MVDRLIHRYVALSGEIETWLVNGIRISQGKVVRICNGVDSERFVPKDGARAPGQVIIGTVMRLSDIKDPGVVVDAFARLLSEHCDGSASPRLMMIGDGPLKADIEQRVREAGIEADVDLPGAQLDVVPWLQRMDVFVLASRREGISNTILEAMSCGLPVVATRTGGNPELVDEPATGVLVPVGDPVALATALSGLVRDPCRRRHVGCQARRRVLERFSMAGMVEQYAQLYLNELRSHS
jgi:glycosyltransferase involved in cell wall biosynthesis